MQSQSTETTRAGLHDLCRGRLLGPIGERACIIGVDNTRSPIMNDHGWSHVAGSGRLGWLTVLHCLEVTGTWPSGGRGRVLNVGKGTGRRLLCVVGTWFIFITSLIWFYVSLGVPNTAASFRFGSSPPGSVGLQAKLSSPTTNPIYLPEKLIL